MSTGSNEPGKLCLVVRQDVHLARKYSENVRGGTLFVTTACGEDGKQRKVYALFVILTGRSRFTVISTDRREWRNLPGELRRAPAAGNTLRSG